MFIDCELVTCVSHSFLANHPIVLTLDSLGFWGIYWVNLPYFTAIEQALIKVFLNPKKLCFELNTLVEAALLPHPL